MSVAEEIKALRRLEADIVRANTGLDRLQRDLVGAHPGNLVIFGFMPPGTWAYLPEGWQGLSELPLTPRFGLPPGDVRGAVAVSVDVAEGIVGRRVF